MPGFTTHYLFGQQTYQQLHTSTLKRTIQKNHTAFCLGLQGPDIFFYDPLSAVCRIHPGSIAHTTGTGTFLKHLLKSPVIFCTKEEQLIAHAYILGFIGHYLLDAACHPYIYAKTHYDCPKKEKKGYLAHHIRLETDIDSTLLWFYQRRHPSEFHQNESIALSKEQADVISAALSYAFSNTYPNLHLNRHRILLAIHAMQKGTKLLYDPSGRKKLLLRRIESICPGYPVISPMIPSDTLLFHKDPCNSRHAIWQNPWASDHSSSESFFDLFEAAQEEYADILNAVADFFEKEPSLPEAETALEKLSASLGKRSYHSGLDTL